MNFFKKKTPKVSIFSVQQDGVFGSRLEHASLKTFDVFLEKGASIFQKPHQTVHSIVQNKRLWWSFVVVMAVLGIFFSRALYLQLMKGGYYHVLADENRYHTTRIVSPRGKIFDRNNQLLATNIPSFLLTMTIARLPKDEQERNKEFQKICDLTGVQRTDLDLLLTQYAKRTKEDIPVVRKMSHEAAMKLSIQLDDLPGFELIASTQRSYPSAILSLSHILGYAGKITAEEYEAMATQGYRPIDLLGKAGLEKSYEQTLRGIPGKKVVEVNASGMELSVISKSDPTPGDDLVLGLDATFQKYIETRLQDTLKAHGVSRGTVIAMDPQTGLLRAVVSLPAYDNNQFAEGLDPETYKLLAEDKNLPLFFRAVSGEYPSGSTFKPVVAYAALAEHLISEHTSFLSNGGLRIGEWFFPDWKVGGHGVTDVRKAIAESVNTFFYIIGGGFDQTTGLGVEKIVAYAKKFGFGSRTNIDVPGEANGFLPSKEWKQKAKGERWYVGDTYHLAIGQGDFLTSPIQLAQMTSVFANSGTIHQPHFVEYVKENGAIKPVTFESKQVSELDSQAIQIVRDGMRQTVVYGSARPLQTLSFPTAGKTGTAQSKPGSPTHAWFTGFGPYDEPTLTLTILIEEGGESFTTAVPLAKDIFAWWYAHQKP